jgi:hypothetical protein
MSSRLWKIACKEDWFPGMWQRWYKNQCAAVGWPPQSGFKLKGKTKGGHGWSFARRLMAEEIKLGDYIIVSLQGHRIGRIGEVTKIAVEDGEWSPLVPRSKDYPAGEMGRRILVRWELEIGPDDEKLVVALPEGTRLTLGQLRPTVAEVPFRRLRGLLRVMKDPSNWVGLSEFPYERALSDYIGAYPHLLEDGLLPHPNKKVRERIFGDRSRLDVLLEDRDGVPVIVESKQRQPSVDNVRQLQYYVRRFQREEGQKARGILVHGGARKLRSEVRRAARKTPIVELVQFRVDVGFSRSD